MNNSKPVIWTLSGVGIGFGLPALFSLCLVALIVFGCLGTLNFSAAGSNLAEPAYVSGPTIGPAVAIIDINGVITTGSAGSFSTESVAASDDIIPLIKEAAADAEVKVILLRINSPGGSVVPSDEIYHVLKECGKPVVVFMRDLAASGAYYISMSAKYIIATPNTLTGSIGVISEFPEASQLMQNIGVTVSVIKSGAVKDLGSMYRPMTEEERTYWQALVDETYNGFVDIVAEGRKMKREKVLALADGRVYTGRQALKLGLIDGLGYEEDAIAKAADIGGIKDAPRVVHYAPAHSFASLLTGFSRLASPAASWFSDLLAPKIEMRWVP